ncbi:MAG: YigZ family protein [Acholeplasmataceae bacterium]|nr:YigZ family protein [Acholeplasmataceae bacterium]
MFTIKEAAFFEQTINKSRFLCYLFPVSSVQEAQDQLSQIRKKHYDATHNCYAYLIGTDGLTAKFSDDGEPSQTAGIVIQEVLKKNDLTNILAIVTRYFGGIKLGSGGLIRAYGSSVSEAIRMVEKLKIEQTIILKINADYSYLNTINKLLEDYEITNRSFNEAVEIEVKIPLHEKDSLMQSLINATNNNIQIETVE